MRTGSDSSTATDSPPTDRRRVLVAATLVGLLGLLLAAAWSWQPSFWYDEAATISAINRSYPQLFSLVHHTDAVHAAYYVVLKAWASVFGLSEFAVRFPSAIAVGAAAAALVVLAERLWDLRFGVLAGLILLTIPRVMWAGSEARSYAGTLFLAIVVTLLLIIAADRGRWWWVAYALGVVVMVVWFFLAITLLLAHALYLLLLHRKAIRGFTIGTAVAVLALVPFGRWAFGQREQVSWIPDMSVQRVWTYARFEFFTGSVAYPIVAGLALAIALMAAVTTWRLDGVRPFVLAWCWLLLPAAVIFAVSWTGTHLYAPRYLVFTVPGMALLLAWSVTVLARESRWVIGVALIALVAAAAPQYVTQRGTYGHLGGSDFSTVADYIGDHAEPGDCVAFGSAPSWSPISQRVTLRAKPADFAGLRDIGARVAAAPSGRMWDLERPVPAYRYFARSCQVMWVVADGERSRRAVEFPGGMSDWYFEPYHFTNTPLYRQLSAAGLHITDRTEFNHSQVVRMQR
ncbi:glycosyltransferase family 39 protein [Gordonia sp. DT30]|uniref:glycosyltransferase family 39 protein n=1 Tax=unclassified Gordonia (in: high G+C Gram-positive bacteria) TaxID=2657482 RepID=UPI003CF0D6C7